MAKRCENCNKGVGYGHAVSHAKNRLSRLFKPNLQKLKIFKNGALVRVTLCTRCIKRLKKDGKIGFLFLKKAVPKKAVVPALSKEEYKKQVEKVVAKAVVKEKTLEKKVKEKRAKETLKIEEIVGTKK